MLPDDKLRNCPIPALPFAVMAADAPRRRGRPPAGGREAILAATLELVREQGVGRLTTRSVVESIFLVIIFDALFSILFSYLGF